MQLLWSIRKKTSAREPLSDGEIILLREFFEAAGVTKYSRAPTNDYEVYFMLDAVRLQQARQTGLLAEGFTVFSSDFHYSPAAFGGDYERWEQKFSWFLDLPDDSRGI